MQVLTLQDFRPYVGQVYEVAVENVRIPLTLGAAQELPSMGSEGRSFRLEFIGPPEPMLPQSIYPIHRADACHDIFIVPVGQNQSGTCYEAIFA